MSISDQLKNQFLSLYAIAVADDNIDPRELKFLYDLGQQKGISQEDMDQLLLNPAKEILNKPETLSEKIEYLYMAAGMILADGIIDKREKLLFRSICQRMGFLEENIPELMDFMLEKVKQGMTVEKVLEIVQHNTEE